MEQRKEQLREVISLMEYDLEQGTLDNNAYNAGVIDGLYKALDILGGKSAGEVY